MVEKVLTKEKKASDIASLKASLEKAKMAVVSDYRGLSVKEITDLRRQLQKVDADYTVAKNTLIKVALKDHPMGETLAPFLSGPTALAISYGDPVAPAKILSDFMRTSKKTDIRGGVLEGKAVDAGQVKAIAELPSREVLIAKALGSMKSPITGIVMVLSAVPKSLVYTLEAIRKQKEASA